MKRIKSIASCALLILILMSSAACSQTQTGQASGSLTVSAAASLKDALTEIKQLYIKDNPAIEVNLNCGSSGSLAAQISEGAEVDLFISAAAQQMTDLQDKDLVAEDSVVNLLGNQLVLIVPQDSALPITSFTDVTSDQVKKIAIGEPSSVPAGKYAVEVFTNLNILDAIQPKIINSKDVTEALTWVESGNADAGVVYATDALSSDKIKVAAVAAENTHSPIVYPAAIIKSGKNPAGAESFMKFIKSDKAKAVFEKYGFTFLNE